MVYDVYYTTGGGPWVNAGTDTWVNLWMELIAPKLKVKPILLLHRNKPKGHEDYEFPIEAYWHGDDIDKFEELCNGARRINILHGHYTPMKVIEENKHKIHSNILHNSVDHILKSQFSSDASFIQHPYIDSKWETEINDVSNHSIWIGVYEILVKNKNIPNFYEFKQNLPLSDSNTIGFAADLNKELGISAEESARLGMQNLSADAIFSKFSIFFINCIIFGDASATSSKNCFWLKDCLSNLCNI